MRRKRRWRRNSNEIRKRRKRKEEGKRSLAQIITGGRWRRMRSPLHLSSFLIRLRRKAV